MKKVQKNNMNDSTWILFGSFFNAEEPEIYFMKRYEKVKDRSIKATICLFTDNRSPSRSKQESFIVAASFIIRLLSGKLFDVYGQVIILIPCSLLSIIVLSILYSAEIDIMFLTAAVFYGFGFGAIFPDIQTWCMNLVEEHEHENAMASFFNSFDLGIGGGAFLLGLFAAATSYETVYLVTSIVYGLVFIICVGYFEKAKLNKHSRKRTQVANDSSF